MLQDLEKKSFDFMFKLFSIGDQDKGLNSENLDGIYKDFFTEYKRVLVEEPDIDELNRKVRTLLNETNLAITEDPFSERFILLWLEEVLPKISPRQDIERGLTTKLLDSNYIGWEDVQLLIYMFDYRLRYASKKEFFSALVLALGAASFEFKIQEGIKRAKFVELYNDFDGTYFPDLEEFKSIIFQFPDNHILKVLGAASSAAQAIEREDLEPRVARTNVLDSDKKPPRIEPLEDLKIDGDEDDE